MRISIDRVGEGKRFVESSKLRSLLAALFVLGLGMLTAMTTLAFFSNAHQNQLRVFEKRKLIGPEIVSIVDIEREDKPLSLGREFEASEDWLKGVNFRLRNDSGKQIVHIAFELEFPDTASSGNVMIFPIWLGQRPGAIVSSGVEPLSVQPSEKLTITIDDDTYARCVKFIESRQPLSSIAKVIIRVQFVAFDDGTAWSGGEYLRQDPRNPKAYVPIKSAQN